MIPEKGSDVVQIPITFDSNTGSGLENGKYKGLWVFLNFVIWLFFTIIIFVAATGVWFFILFGVVSVASIYVNRFVIFRENFHRRKRRELKKNNYQFGTSQLWNIYEIRDKYPYMCYYANGYKGLFVVMEKDIIVGKPEDNKSNHREAVGDVRGFALKKNIEFTHIDYMDTVGEDSRIDNLFEQAENVANPDLRKLLIHIYDNVSGVMNNSYTSYDVYCFMSKSSDKIFFEDVLKVVSEFKRKANYIRFKVLNARDVGKLAKAVFGLGNFSAKQAGEDLFAELNPVSNLRVIWTEKDGERTVINKTTQELEAIRNIRMEEKSVKKKRNFKMPTLKLGKKKLNEQEEQDEDVSLF